eukprot:gene27721-7367_t
MAWNLKSDWSRSLGGLVPVTDEKLDPLLHLCDAAATPSDAADALEQLVSLLSFLKYSNGQRADRVLPHVLSRLRVLETNWLSAESGHMDTGELLMNMLSGVSSFLWCPSAGTGLQQELSDAMQQLISHLLPLYCQQGNADGTKVQSFSTAHCLAWALSHSPDPTATTQAQAPSSVNADGALDILEEHVMQLMEQEPKGTAVAPVYLDGKAILILCALVRTALAGPGSGEAAGAEPGSSSEAEEGGGSKPSSGKQTAVLSSIVDWAIASVRAALVRMRQSGSEATEERKTQALPTGSATRATAKLALLASAGLLSAGGQQAIEKVESVMDTILEMCEVVILAATGMAAGDPNRDKVLFAAAGLIQDCAKLVGTPETLEAHQSAGTNSRLRSLLLGAANMVPHTAAASAATSNGNSAPAPDMWDWEVTQPLTMSATASRVPGWGAQHFCCSVSEVLSSALAASWNAGQHSYVLSQAIMVLSRESREQQAIVLTSSRVYMLLGCDAEYASMTMPVGIDAVSSGRHDLSPEVLACISRSYAKNAAAAASTHSADDWAFTQVADLMIRLFRDSEAPTASKAPLADNITQLTRGMKQAPESSRHEIQIRLLTLFSELGMKMGSSREVEKDMVALLPALGEAFDGGLSPHSNSCIGNGRLVSLDLTNAYKQSAGLVKLLRNFWLHASLMKVPKEKEAALGLVAAATPMLLITSTTEAAGGQSEMLKMELGTRLAHAGSAADPNTLRTSLASLAAGGALPPMPLEKNAYLKMLFAAELSRSGLAPLPMPGAPSPVAVSLGYLQVAEPLSEDAVWFSVLAEKAFSKYIEQIEAERSRLRAKAEAVEEIKLNATVSRGFIHGFGLVVHGSSLAPMLGNASCSLVHETKEDAVRSVGYSFVGRTPVSKAGSKPLINTGTSAFDAGKDTPFLETPVPAAVQEAAKLILTADPDACLEDLCVTLVRHLSNTTGQEEGVAPQVVQVADGLLKLLLGKYPGLHYNSNCLSVLLEMLEAEEGEVPLGQLRTSTATAGASTAVWKVLRSWVYTAASRAPGRTEALLHQFLGQDAGSHRIDGAASSPFGSDQAVNAAFRRSSDLLNICVDARKQNLVTAPGQMRRNYIGGTNELCRKQYFTGVVVGLQLAQSRGLSGLGDVDMDAVARGIEEALNIAISDGAPMSVLEHSYLAAAALLALGSVHPNNAACYSLMCSLCDVPLQRLTVEMMHLASFALTWVGTASSFCAGNEARLLQGLHCHREVLSVISEMWDAVADKSNGEQAALSQTLHRLLDLSLEDLDALCPHSSAVAARFRTLHRLLHHSLEDLDALCSHPAAVAARFRLLHLSLRYCISRLKDGPSNTIALLIFANPPSFSAHVTQSQADEFVNSLSAFKQLLGKVTEWPSASTSVPSLSQASSDTSRAHNPTLLALTTARIAPDADSVSDPVWGKPFSGLSAVSTPEVVKLLDFLLSTDIERLKVWAKPLDFVSGSGASKAPAPKPPAMSWDKGIATAWKVHPKLAVALVERFPFARDAKVSVEKLLIGHAHEPVVQAIPEAAIMLAKAAPSNAPQLAALTVWAPAQAVDGLELLSSQAGRNTTVKAYAVRCLGKTPPEQVAFFLPQLVQILRHDEDKAIQSSLLDMASKSDLFAHQLIWALKTEEKPPEEEFNPEVKRSGWEAPKDFGLWDIAERLQEQALAVLTPASREYWNDENDYFNKITSISGILKKHEKDERKSRIAEELRKFEPSRANLYVPTNPDRRVVKHIPTSGTPMQSAAKVPILVAFEVQDQPIPTGSIGDQQDEVSEDQVHLSAPTHKLACIFKVGDDCRQDVLALQVIHLLKDAFTKAGLGLYLAPYGCLPTGYGRGVIEVVPNTKSRAALGELSDRGLYEIFQNDFGAPGTPAFESARRNFIASEAGYAIASFLLQAKDRHNGNILIDAEGNLVHIDFGFILEISPGGNMGFESAAFKLSHEMTQLLDPGNTRNSTHFHMFLQLCIRGYLAARTVAEPIIATVALMAESGLPCYGRGAPVENLRKRFHLEMSERQAAQFMYDSVQDSYQKWTTKFYDYIQDLQNKIPY